MDCNPLAIWVINKSLYILRNAISVTNDSSFGLYIKKETWSSSFGSRKFRKKGIIEKERESTMNDRKINMLKRELLDF